MADLQEKYGIEQQYEMEIPNYSMGTIIQLKKNTFLALGNTRVFIFRKGRIIKSFPIALSTIVMIPEYNLFVGVTLTQPQFVLIPMASKLVPTYTGLKINDISIFNIVFFPKISVLATFGEKIQTWKINYSPPTLLEKSHCEISFLKFVFHNNESYILNPPIADIRTNRFFIPNGDFLKIYE